MGSARRYRGAPLQGPSFPGLPHDKHGFIPVDSHGRVSGLDNVYAAGDATTFPLKQGGLAATISIGGAFLDMGTQTHHDALLAADTALYAAKTAGGDRAILHESSPGA